MPVTLLTNLQSMCGIANCDGEDMLTEVVSLVIEGSPQQRDAAFHPAAGAATSFMAVVQKLTGVAVELEPALSCSCCASGKGVEAYLLK